jgi:hypothetical protein
VTGARSGAIVCLGFTLALAASGCGSNSFSGAGSSSSVARVSVARQATAASRPVAALPHLSIISPRAGVHVGQTLTVRVRVSGTNATSQRLRYVLDGRLTRLGSPHLTYHELAPGHHRLEVLLADQSVGHAFTTFTVRAPEPVAVPAPEPASPMTTPSPPPPQPESTSPPRSSSATTQPSPMTSSSPPPPPPPPHEPTMSEASPPSGGIPQGGGGDGDGDNSGGPSDGDGNV